MPFSLSSTVKMAKILVLLENSKHVEKHWTLLTETLLKLHASCCCKTLVEFQMSVILFLLLIND